MTDPAMRSKVYRLCFEAMDGAAAPNVAWFDAYFKQKNVASVFAQDMWRLKVSPEAAAEIARYLDAVAGRSGEREFKDKSPIIATGLCLAQLAGKPPAWIEDFIRFTVETLMGGEAAVMDQVASTPLNLLLCALAKYRPGGSVGTNLTGPDPTRIISVHNYLEDAWRKYQQHLPSPSEPWHALRLASVLTALRWADRNLIFDERSLKKAMEADKQNFVVKYTTGAGPLRAPRVEFLDTARGSPYERDPTTGDITPYMEGNVYPHKQEYAVWVRFAEIERIGQLAATGETAALSLTPAALPDFLATLMDGTWGGYDCLRGHEWGHFERFWTMPLRSELNFTADDYLYTALEAPDNLSSPSLHPFIMGLEDEPSDDEEQSHVAKRARPADPTEGAGSQFDLTQDGSRSVRANPTDDQVRCPQPPYT